MTHDSVAQRYANLSIILHWLILALFFGVYACIEIVAVNSSRTRF